MPSQWLAQAPVTQEEASERNSGPADVVPPTAELQEADKEPKVPGNGKGRGKANKKKKKDNSTAQNASSQNTVGELANLVDTSQVIKEESQPAPDVVESKTIQAAQDDGPPKKAAKKNKKKPAKRGLSLVEQTSDIPSAPVESIPAESAPVSTAPTECAPVESADTLETTAVIGKGESISSVITTKPYRADAGGSLHVFRQRYKPAIRDIFAPPQDVDIPEEWAPDNNVRGGKSLCNIAPANSPKLQQEATKEQTRKKIHGSFGNLDVGFNPWPRAPSGEVWSPTKRPTVANTSIKRSTTPAPPQVIIEPAPAVDTVTKYGLPTPSRVAFKDTTETIGLGEDIYAHQRGTGSKKPSGSSFVSMTESQYTTASYHTAKSSLSSGEKTPPESTPPASP